MLWLFSSTTVCLSTGRDGVQVVTAFMLIEILFWYIMHSRDFTNIFAPTPVLYSQYT